LGSRVRTSFPAPIKKAQNFGFVLFFVCKKL
jgi:hypothetical protein